MNARGPTLVLLVAVLSLAGCQSKDPADAEQSLSSSTSSNPSQTTSQTSNDKAPLNGTPERIPSLIAWSDCNGFGGSVLFPRFMPEKVPQGWSQSAEPYEGFFLRLAECSRMSVGPFERGPVTILLDMIGGPNAPDSCLEGPFTSYMTLWSLVVSDPEIAAYLANNLSMPAYFGTFSHDESSGPAGAVTYSWTVEGLGASTLTMPKAEAIPNNNRGVDRVFWWNETTMFRLDVLKEFTYYDTSPPQGVGRVEAPISYASNGFNDFQFQADLHPQMTWTGTLAAFQDTECSEPL